LPCCPGHVLCPFCGSGQVGHIVSTTGELGSRHPAPDDGASNRHNSYDSLPPFQFYAGHGIPARESLVDTFDGANPRQEVQPEAQDEPKHAQPNQDRSRGAGRFEAIGWGIAVMGESRLW
jgi:hypothetical protein